MISLSTDAYVRGPAADVPSITRMNSTLNLSDETLARELAHHDELYSGFAQQHFAKPAVRELRRHMVQRILDGHRCRVGNRAC